MVIVMGMFVDNVIVVVEGMMIWMVIGGIVKLVVSFIVKWI